MLLVPMIRRELLNHVPKGGRFVEIGVAEGDFSQSILQACQPRVLELIDPWLHQADAHLAHDKNNPSQQIQDERHDAVCRRFEAEIQQGRIHVHRRFSHQKLAEFEDQSIDAAYVDGDHSYAGVARDLDALRPKMVAGGLIMGHDFTRHGTVEFGVIEAVTEFVDKNVYRFVALSTLEMFPTIAITDRMMGTSQAFVENLLTHVRGLTHIRAFPEKLTYQPIYVKDHQGRWSFIPTFV